MSQTPKKQTFLHGAALLAMATAIVKIIGALYKLPLKMVIGDQGYSYFCTAYDIYSVLLMISTAGLPVAMSRMISQASSLGHYNQVRRVYNTARALFLGLGAASSLLMILFCRELAAFQQQPSAAAAIMALGPCAFLMGLMSTYRGFFQGQGNMIPTSTSQIIEAIIKLVVGLVGAVALLKLTNSVPLAAAGAIAGVTASCMISSIFLFSQLRGAYTVLPKTSETVTSYGKTAKQLLAIAVPITIGAAGLQMLTVVENNLYMGQLLTAGGLSQDVAEHTNGVYKMAQTIYNMPCAFITPITISIIPAITSQLTMGNHKGVKATEESAARVTALLSLPCAVGLIVLSQPIMALLGGYSGEKLALASSLMSLLGISVFLHAIVLLTNAIMQAHGHPNFPVVNMLCSGVVRLVVVYILTGNPAIGIMGVPIGTALCNLCIAVLNLFAMGKCVPQKPALLSNLLRPLLPVAFMAVAAYGSWQGLLAILGSDASRIILCGVPIALAGCVYLLCIPLFKAITAEDCMLLPKGEKIAKILHLL